MIVYIWILIITHEFYCYIAGMQAITFNIWLGFTCMISNPKNIAVYKCNYICKLVIIHFPFTKYR